MNEVSQRTERRGPLLVEVDTVADILLFGKAALFAWRQPQTKPRDKERMR
jgi:hypothetical protein